MFHPGRFDLKSVPSNNVMCTSLMNPPTFTLFVSLQFLTACRKRERERQRETETDRQTETDGQTET